MYVEAEHNRRGLMRLMLKVPALRGKLQRLTASNADLFSLCGAFEDASSTLDQLRRETSQASATVLTEYEQLCGEIEREIVEFCNS
jgi:hypothetical protein